MNRNFQVYGISLLLLVIVLSLFISETISFEKVNNFEDCVDAGNPVMESYPRQCRHRDVTYVEELDGKGSEDPSGPMNIDEYFAIELYEQAIKNNDGRIPIEGFDPYLYKGAFPGFEDSDFNGAKAVGGIWVFNQELKWIETNLGGPITSADGTLTNEGLMKVLDNLERRLEVVVESEVDVDNIISMLNIHKCGDEERKAEACITLHDPVCGWNDPEKIQCIKYPCAQTYSNGCDACIQENVLYWTPGECPASV